MKPIEKELLTLLRENARMPVADLAKALRIDEKSVESHIQTLEKSGAILSYTTVINENIAGNSGSPIQALVEVSIRPEKKFGYDAIAKRIFKYPNVVGHYLLSGQYDFLVIVEGNNHQEIAAFVFDKIATLDNVTSTNTHFIFKKYKEHGIVIEKEDTPSREVVVA